MRGEGGGGGQADVAQPEDTDFGEVHFCSKRRGFDYELLVSNS
jgi:hypothetical protein